LLLSGLDSRHVRKGHRMTTGRRAGNRDTTANGLSPSSRRSRDARQILPGQRFAPGAAVLGSQAGLRAVGAPWWTICLLGTIGLAVVGLQIVFPQDSPDKVAWWSERRRTRRHCQRRRCQCPHETALPRKCPTRLGCPGSLDGAGVAQVQQSPVRHAADIDAAGRGRGR
jgi:hypothetical protein